jgi:Ser/Thr protein kinase RdoA (MazF antagonist)
MRELPKASRTFGITHADFHISNIHVTAEGPESATAIAIFDFDDSCYHYFVHDVAVAVTQIRKQGLDIPNFDAAALEHHFLEVYFATRALTRGEEGEMREWLPRFVRFRAALIMCWANVERGDGRLVGSAGDAWFAKSLPIYLRMIEGRPSCKSPQARARYKFG